MFCMLKMRKYILPTFQSKTQIVKKSFSFNDFKRRKMALYYYKKKLSALLRGIMSRHHGDFCCLNCLHPFPAKRKLESHKK